MDLFVLIATIAEHDGAAPLNERDGVWVRRLDDDWLIAVNGHLEPREYEGVAVPPFTCYVEYNGWPAGMLTPFDGALAAGESANLDTFATALRQAVAR